MKLKSTSRFLITLCFILPQLAFAQFDFYGPKPFSDILESSYSKSWTPTSISAIENLQYVVILDQATQTNAISINQSDFEKVEMVPVSDITGASATLGNMMRSIFQMVDENTHYENDPGGGSGEYSPLSGLFKLNPILHSYYNLNSDGAANAIITDGGTFYIADHTDPGYLLIDFEGSSSSTTIKAVSQFIYNEGSDLLEENTSWTPKYLMIDGNNLMWTDSPDNASDFFLADATDLLSIKIADGSDFNPLNVTYQPNATAAIPDDIDAMENSQLISDFIKDLDSSYEDQLGNSASATTAATTALDDIESSLNNSGGQLRYPKSFYLAVRENMLSHTIGSSDIFNAVLGNNTVEHVYFTNASDDSGVPHPFMVIAAHAVSTRPNLLLDVNRPPGATSGAGYAQSTVTRHGKLGEFLVKIPLKDYGLINDLLDNDLSAYGDLASDFDDKQGTTTTKDQYNYTGLASVGMAVDGVTIYPAQNNNLRFAVEDGEVTSSGIHVGGGLELHYHADGHAFTGNGINLYNLGDFDGHDHPPVIGMAYDGIALFGKYEDNYSSMVGYGMALDEYGGHDHGDGFGYHYHAHTESITSTTAPNPTFDEHFLLVGAWKGKINNIPGFLELKTNQLQDNAIARYAGATSTPGNNVTDARSERKIISLYPNPVVGNELTIVTKHKSLVILTNAAGQEVGQFEIATGKSIIDLMNYERGLYFINISNSEYSEKFKILLK